MIIKSFVEYITELRKVVSGVSVSGKTKSLDLIWDEPSSPKSPSSGVSLRDKLREEEFQDLITTLSDDKFSLSKSQIRKEKFIRKSDRIRVALNNLQFLKDKQEEADLHCEYCQKGPLVIYDFTEDMVPKKINPHVRFNKRFNEKDGATCDHRDPQSKGGDKFDYSNLAVCCYQCNQRKKNMRYEDWLKLVDNKLVTEDSNTFYYEVDIGTFRGKKSIFMLDRSYYRIKKLFGDNNFRNFSLNRGDKRILFDTETTRHEDIQNSQIQLITVEVMIGEENIMGIDIFECDDEWFKVVPLKYGKNGEVSEQKYIFCDQFEGLIKLLKDYDIID